MGSFYVKKTKEGISSCEKKELMIKIWKGKAYNEVIEATGGKEIRYIRIENSTNTIHGHPNTESKHFKLLR